MSDPQLRTWLIFFRHSVIDHDTGCCQCIFPPRAKGNSLSPRLHPIFIVANLWRWPLWVVGFDFPSSFRLAFLQQLGMLSILFGGGGLGLCFLFFLKECEDNLALGNWLPESRLCLECISPAPAVGRFLTAAVMQEWSSCSSKKCSQGGSTFQAQLGVWGQPEP